MWAPGRWGAGSPPPSSGAAAVLGAGGGGQGPASRSDSTLSLLSPLGHQSCPLDSDDGDAEDGAGAEAGAEAEVEVAALRGLRFCGSASVVESEDNQEEQKQVHLPESRLTPWEVWFVGKEKEERDRLQQKALEELNQQLEKRKEMEEREKRKAIAEEKHKEWVQKKNKQAYQISYAVLDLPLFVKTALLVLLFPSGISVYISWCVVLHCLKLHSHFSYICGIIFLKSFLLCSIKKSAKKNLCYLLAKLVSSNTTLNC